MKRFILGFCLLVAVACRSGVRHMLDRAEALMEYRADSALVLLQEIGAEELGSPGLCARHALLLSMAMEGCAQMPSTDSVALVAYKYYLSLPGHQRQKMHSAYCLAGVSYGLGRMSHSIVLYHEALEYAKACGDTRMAGYVSQRIGELYALNYAHEDALNYAMESVRLLERVGDTLSACYSRIDVARQYLADGQYRRAESMVDSLLAENRGTDLGLKYFLYVLKGDLSYFSKEYELAQEYYHLSEGTGYVLPLQSLGRYALIQQRRGRGHLTDSLLSVMQRSLWTGVDSIVYYSVLVERADLQGDYKSAFEDLARMDEIQSRSYAQILSQSASHAVTAYYEAQLEVEQVRRRSHRMFYILVITILGIVIVLIGRALHRHRQKTITEMLKVEDLERDIQLLRASKNSADFMIATFVQDKIKTMTQLTEAYFYWSDEAVKKREEREGQDLKEDVIDKIRGEMKRLRTDAHFISSIENALDETHDGVIRSLRADFSGLNPPLPKFKSEDFQILVLLFAGFSNKSVSFLVNLTDEAVRSRKKRYRKLFENMPGDNGKSYLALLKREMGVNDTFLPHE